LRIPQYNFTLTLFFIFLIKSDLYNLKKLTTHYINVYTYYNMITGLNRSIIKTKQIIYDSLKRKNIADVNIRNTN